MFIRLYTYVHTRTLFKVCDIHISYIKVIARTACIHHLPKYIPVQGSRIDTAVIVGTTTLSEYRRLREWLIL